MIVTDFSLGRVKQGQAHDPQRNHQKKLDKPKLLFWLMSLVPGLLIASIWDGTGYPQGLKRDAIPLAARIFAVVDVWDALGSNRSYNQAWPREKMISYFIEQSGAHFDPVIVNAFLALTEKGEI